MSNRAVFHIQQNLTPYRLRMILGAVYSEREPDLAHLASQCGLRLSVLKGVVIPFVRQMGLLSHRGLKLSPKGEAFYYLAQYDARLLGEAVHAYLYTLHHFEQNKYFSWAYAWLVDSLWERGWGGLTRQVIGDLVGLLIEEAASQFKLSTSDIAFSSNSVRGALLWLEALQPPILTHQGRQTSISQRYYCMPLSFLWAVDFLYKHQNISYGTRLRLTLERETLLCRMCFLHAQGLPNVMQMTKSTTDYERGGFFDYGTEGGLGKWLLLSRPCPVPHIPGKNADL